MWPPPKPPPICPPPPKPPPPCPPNATASGGTEAAASATLAVSTTANLRNLCNIGYLPLKGGGARETGPLSVGAVTSRPAGGSANLIKYFFPRGLGSASEAHCPARL